MKKNPEISIVEITTKILKSWKQCLILAVVCAILLGAFQFIKLNGSEVPVEEPKKEEKKPDLTYEEYLRQISYNTGRIEYYTGLYNETKEYYDNSYYMSINPYNCVSVASTCIFYGNNEYTEAAAASMITIVKNTDCAANNIASGTAIENLDGQYINELISVSSPNDSVNLDSPRFTISVIAADKNTAQTILNNLIDYAEKEYMSSINFLRSASLSWEFSPVFSETCYSSSLRNAQISLSKDLIGYEDSIVKFEDALRKLNKEYSSIYPEGYVKPAPNSEPTPASAKYSASEAAKSAAIYALIGFIIGVVIGVAIDFIRVIKCPKLCYTRQIFDNTKIKFIGNIEDNENIKRLNKFCKKIAGDKDFMSPRTERLTYTAANLAALSKDKRVLVTGTPNATDVQSAIETLKKADDSLQLSYKGNLTSSAAAVKALDDTDAILIMEQLDTTAIKSLASLLDSCLFTDKDIIGYVII